MANQSELRIATSGSEARRLGLSRYFTGKPCAQGHISVRSVNGVCMECGRVRSKVLHKQIQGDPVLLEARREYTRLRMRGYLADPAYRKKVRENERKNSKSPARRATKAAIDSRRYENADFRVKLTERAFVRYHATKNDPIAKAKRKKLYLKFYGSNREKYYAACAKRRAVRAQATPKWFSKEMQRDIEALYVTARKLSEETGTPHDVDHIIPLKNSIVCGLHVIQNLQVIPMAANRSKGNSFDPAQWEFHV